MYRSRRQYAWWRFAPEVQHIYGRYIRAAQCIQGGEREEGCLQGIPISRWMPTIHRVLGEEKPHVRNLPSVVP